MGFYLLTLCTLRSFLKICSCTVAVLLAQRGDSFLVGDLYVWRPVLETGAETNLTMDWKKVHIH